MENNNRYKIYYVNNFVCTITAHSEFEAIDKVYYTYIESNPTIQRNLFITKKL